MGIEIWKEYEQSLEREDFDMYDAKELCYSLIYLKSDEFSDYLSVPIELVEKIEEYSPEARETLVRDGEKLVNGYVDYAEHALNEGYLPSGGGVTFLFIRDYAEEYEKMDLKERVLSLLDLYKKVEDEVVKNSQEKMAEMLAETDSISIREARKRVQERVKQRKQWWMEALKEYVGIADTA